MRVGGTGAGPKRTGASASPPRADGREVLFKAGSRFRVLDKRRDAQGVTHIEMKEVDDA